MLRRAPRINMYPATQRNIHIHIPPPSEKKQTIKDKSWLVLQFIWLLVLIVPCNLFCIFRMIFPRKGKSLKGQVTMVTGAGRGIGRGLALRCAAEGCKVAVVDIDRVTAEEAVEEIQKTGGIAKAYVVDISKSEEVRFLQEQVTRDLGPVDLLINNAGLVYSSSIETGSDDEIKTVINVNLLSHFLMVRTFLPSMKERNSGHIVANASASGLSGVANMTAYSATKFGVRGFMEALREELQEMSGNKIKTTTILPYFINTSAHYVETFDLRLPPLTTEEAVIGIITAVKRDYVTVTIPGYFYIFLNLSRLLPQYLLDYSRKVVYVRAILPSRKERDKTPSTALVLELARHANIR